MKFGVCGLGKIGTRMSKALNMSDVAELYAVAARDLGKATAFAERYGAKKAYNSYLDLITDPEVDAVYIGVIHTEHNKIAQLCIENHKPFICEKPFGVDSKRTEELFAMAEKEKVFCMEGMWTRTLPAIRKAKEWIDAGRIGDVRLLHADFGFAYPYDFDENAKKHYLWRADEAGGSMWDASVYPYEFFTGMVGEHPEEVSGTLYWEHGVDASCCFALRFPCGAIADGKASIVGKTDYTGWISGTKGYIEQKEFWCSPECVLYDNDGNVIDRFMSSFEEGFLYELEHFVDMVKSGATDSTLIPHSDTIDFQRSAEILRKLSPEKK